MEIIIKDFTDRYKDKGIDYVVGADARGFIFGAAIAYNIGAGFVPARKPGKLPAEVESIEYSLEYGKNSIEIHKDAFEKDSKILIIGSSDQYGPVKPEECPINEEKIQNPQVLMV